MATLKKEEVRQLAEPIIIEAGILGEKEYRVEKITTELLEEVDKLTLKDTTQKNLPIDTSIKQLALLLGVSSDELKVVELRVVNEVLKFVQSEIVKGLQIKNSEAEVKH